MRFIQNETQCIHAFEQLSHCLHFLLIEQSTRTQTMSTLFFDHRTILDMKRFALYAYASLCLQNQFCKLLKTTLIDN